MTAGRPRRARKIDANQPDIVKKLRAQGFTVRVINGDFDILVGWANHSLPVEIKNPEAGGTTNARQDLMWEDWRGSYLVAETADEIIDWFGRNVVCRK
jgi:hypothetical protein